MSSLESEKKIRIHKEGEQKSLLSRSLEWLDKRVPFDTPLVIPFSGGLDSAVTVGLLTQVRGAKNIIAIRSNHSTELSHEAQNAAFVAQQLGISPISFNLDPLADSYAGYVQQLRRTIGSNSDTAQITEDIALINTLARSGARQGKGTVIGTLDLSEILTGYFPKSSFTGDLLPLGGLVRYEVRELAKGLGLPELPEEHEVVRGCGDIVGYANGELDIYGGSIFRSERDLDSAILGMLATWLLRENPTPLEILCSDNSHKSREALLGREIFYPDNTRERQIQAWFQ